MKISFIHSIYESLGVEYLSAYLKKEGHQTKLFFNPVLFKSHYFVNRTLNKVFDYSQDLVREVIDSDPDLICMSVTSSDYVWACSTAREIKKKKNIPIIFGGFHPTSVPEKVIKENSVDFICVGEGEEALSELANAIEHGKKITDIANIWYKKDGKIIINSLRPLISDLDSLPFPDKDLFYDEYNGFSTVYTILSGRGCPFVCTYCFNSLFRRIYKNMGPYVRRRSVDNVIEELRLAKKKHLIKNVLFADDIFVYDIGWLKEFSKEYKDLVGLPFFCSVHPTFVNEEVVDLLQSAGCATIDMGVQTISEDLRSVYLHRRDTNYQIKRAIQLFRKTKIFVAIGIILGLPEQGEDEAIDIAKFFNQNRPNLMAVFWLRYYPRIDIVEIAKKKGLISEEDIENIEEGREAEFFLIGYGISYNKNLAKIANLIFISFLISSKIMGFIIKNKLYRFFPTSTLLYQKMLSPLITFYSSAFERKKRVTHFQFWFVLKFHIIYAIKRFRILIKNLRLFNNNY